MKNISMIGAGNLATQLSIRLKDKGYKIRQVWSRSNQSAESLAVKLESEPITDINKIKPAELLIIAIKDDAVESLIKKLLFLNIPIVHTTGSLGLKMFNKSKINHGVIYPIQTFNKNISINLEETPLCIEANNKDFEGKLINLAKSISESVHKINYIQRKRIHLAAVFACNFPNHMFSIAKDILEKENLNFDLLKPLISETFKKVQDHDPSKIQTGPAIRKDYETIENHYKEIKEDELREIYSLITHHIIKSNDNK